MRDPGRALQAGAGQHDGVVIAGVELGQAGVDVAAQVAAIAGPGAGRAAVPAGAATRCRPAHPAAMRRCSEALIADEGIGRIGAFEDRRQREAGSSSIGTSLSECTAQSASPRSIATSSSFRNRPLPPISASVGRAFGRRACSSAPARRPARDARRAGARPRVRSAIGRAGFCGWRCAGSASCGMMAIGAGREVADRPASARLRTTLSGGRRQSSAARRKCWTAGRSWDTQRGPTSSGSLAAPQHRLHMAIAATPAVRPPPARATRQFRWMRTNASPNSASSYFSDSSIRSSPRAWCTTTYFSSACK